MLELIPPSVATNLMGGRSDPRAMPLDQYIAETMRVLEAQPTPPEICLEQVKLLRYAAENGRVDAIFEGINSSFADIQ